MILSKGWRVIQIRDERYPKHTVHTVPIFDLYDHALSPKCACKPELEGSTVMHNSYDGREYVEALIDPVNISKN